MGISLFYNNFLWNNYIQNMQIFKWIMLCTYNNLLISSYYQEKYMATHSRFSCLEDPRDRRASWAVIYGVIQSRTQQWLSNSSSHYQWLAIDDKNVINVHAMSDLVYNLGDNIKLCFIIWHFLFILCSLWWYFYLSIFLISIINFP